MCKKKKSETISDIVLSIYEFQIIHILLIYDNNVSDFHIH